MKLNLFSKIIFAILLAFTINSFVYFSFENIYSAKIFSIQNFQNQFHSGVYQYRILSGYFLIWIYDFLAFLPLDYSIFKFKFINPHSEPQMYLSFYILNTFFFILSSVLMVLITETKSFVASNPEKTLLISVGIFAIAFSQFAIVHYDISSYFFLLLFFLILLNYLERKTNMYLFFLVLIILISTMNRESSALSISLAAALFLAKFGLKKETMYRIAILAISFIVVYLGMRFFNKSFTTNDGSLIFQNLTQPKNLLGMLFWAVFFVFSLLISKDKTAIKNIVFFHLFALPYVFMCFYTGILYEIRLYIPLFLTSIFLSKIEIGEKTNNALKQIL